MLQLENIKKTYHVGEIETKAIDDISLSFRKNEFVAILGTSGSGKTTCLNIIGGLDRYDSGNLIIKGKSTKDFTDKDWDAYRNNSIGFIFQNYNLIPHLSIVANVELGMTLSGESREKKHKRALEVLTQVGLKDHLHKKPNQLSGGQMQRVAIARALANDPEILLCDEPTGALDTKTSKQILDLIKSIADNKLVIMVTHNSQLAESYADRIVEFSDGKIISDSNSYEEQEYQNDFKLKKTSMSYLTALSLSFNNIKTKKGRTFLTSLASSIGIIGIALILSLSTGFQTQIDKYQKNAMSEFPIIISESVMSFTKEQMDEMGNMGKQQKDVEFASTDKVTLYDPSENSIIHTNKLTDDYVDYVENISTDICSQIGYFRMVNMNLIREINGEYLPVSFSSGVSSGAQSSSFSSMNNAGLSTYPNLHDKNETEYLQRYYDLLEGSYPEKDTDVVLLIDNKNKIDMSIMKSLGFEVNGVDSIKFDDIIGTELKLITNNEFYIKSEHGTYLRSMDYGKLFNSKNSKTVTVTGIIREGNNSNIGLLGSGIIYSDALVQEVLKTSLDSEIVKSQMNSNKNVFTNELLKPEEIKMIINSLGGSSSPNMIMLYPKDFQTKDDITEYLDSYNTGKNDENIVIYTDLASSISNLTKGIMNAITLVLISFAAISLVVSLIMICIITYTSVLERTKEIGVLKALGARKKDITRVFDAETCIIGVFSGLLGITIAYLSTLPINMIIYKLTDLENVANLNPAHAIILVAISTVLTMLGGHIPAKMASKKDAVEALRTE